MIPSVLAVFFFVPPITIATSLVVLVGIIKVRNKLPVSYLSASAALVCVSVGVAILTFIISDL